MNLILQHIQRRGFKDVIIMGDFNSLKKDDYTEEEWSHIINSNQKRYIKTMTLVTDLMNENGYTDSFKWTKRGRENVSVWSMKRVDYIYFSKNYPHKVLNSFTIPTLISDHLPVVCDIEIKSD